ncbi:MAG: hypothetical protein JXM70_28330 [Pirellulales bacterium]|nr:hypothetical protein [Pirellulales bacterium]
MSRKIFPFILIALSFLSISEKELRAANTSWLHNGVTAHRGNSSEFPENTLPAFKSGIELGADWLELDVLRTRDGEIVVIHDHSTRRVAKADLKVADSTYKELAALDVAYRFRKDHKLTLEQCPKATIPRLEDVLRLVMKQKKTRVSIQPKVDCVADVVRIIKRIKAEPWIGFNDGALPLMTQAAQMLPTAKIFWDRFYSNIDSDIRTAKSRGFHSIVMHENDVTKEKIEKIHAAGLESGVWTVNDPTKMRRFLKMGLFRFYTDKPEVLLRIKGRQ